MPKPPLRRIRLQFNKTPILRLAKPEFNTESDSKTLLAVEGPDPQVYENPDHIIVFLYVPWFDDDKAVETEFSRLSEWGRIAQLAILAKHPDLIFEPSFLVGRL